MLSTTSPAWERTDDSLALGLNSKSYKFSNVADCREELENETTTDDFAMSVHGGTLPFYKDIDIVNMAVSDNASKGIKQGDILDRLSTNPNNFNWGATKDGEAVNVMTYYPGHYIKRYQDATHEHIQLSMWNFDGAMYVEPYYRGTFEAVADTTTFGSNEDQKILRSYAGGTVQVSTTIANFRKYAKNNPNENNKMSLGDWRDFDFLCLYLIKYANYNSQTQVGYGIVNLSGRQITGYGGAHITLNGRDGYIGTNQKTSVWCLGLCNPWGNVWEFVDGITIRDHRAYIATDPGYYSAGVNATDGTEGYSRLGYINVSATSGGWPKQLGYDTNNTDNQLIAFPKVIGAASNGTEGTCDYYYTASGVRLVLRGGSYASTYAPATAAGAFYLDCYYVFTHTYGNVGCRLLKTA